MIVVARRIGTINDAAERYDIDGAGIWEIICTDISVTSPDGELVRLVAPPEEREGDDGTLWIVSEVPA